ncbi:3-keto-disaccharide hydrolase [Bacteroides faecalis]|uniref:Endo-1,3-1,4-beta glucanase-related protein n=1 Tax=Bacteroides faecalis TaxID=2447885 RepID=A0A401LNQ9_9BACE|nr:DUF1080 domain-containing protein [Bacteroides faecalis]GCB33168.1 endo-1,3-1,4-beta glucanase-related protein [Bacteroides faecalis]
MKNKIVAIIGLAVLGCNYASAQEGMKPGMSEFYSPVPPVVTPGEEMRGGGFTAPSDAIILFDGKDLSAWENSKGGPAEWKVKNGVITVDKSKGDIRTKEKFGSFQLHLEWRVPKTIQGEGQGRGNSGVYLQGMYEVQILDNYNNPTYVNGQAGSIYKQTAPLANAMRKPGEWNVYDIIYTAPVFKEDGSYRVRPQVTIIQNGVVLQNNTTILGTTEYIGFPKVVKHGDGPILLQSHGDPSEPISFRNIWIRKM